MLSKANPVKAPRRKRMLYPATALAALLLPGCVTAPDASAPIWLGQTSQGAPVMEKQVTSWKALKFEDLVRQRTDFSCGAAVMATVFNYAFGYETTEQQVLVNMLKVADPDVVREKGFSLLDMKTYAQTIGMQAEGYRLTYEAMGQLDLPIIALLNIRGYKHFVVLRKIFPDHVAVGDPALGNRIMTRKEFEAAWNGVAFIVMGDNYDPTNVLIDPPEPLSARRLIDMHAILPGAEAAEYGFAPAYQFRF